MIKARSADDIRKLIVKPLGSGEESSVGLLADGKHVAKIFHSPLDLSDANKLLIGSKVKQKFSSIAFLQDLYGYESFAFGGIAEYADGIKLDHQIINVGFADLTYSTLLLASDLKSISDAKIKVGDTKNFNMIYTDSYIKVVDTGRYEYSLKDEEETYRHNLEMVFSVIRNVFKNSTLEKIFEDAPNLYRAFMNNKEFPEFFRKLGVYTSEKLGEPVYSFGEYIKKTGK